jgi:hypothetical protein
MTLSAGTFKKKPALDYFVIYSVTFFALINAPFPFPERLKAPNQGFLATVACP